MVSQHIFGWCWLCFCFGQEESLHGSWDKACNIPFGHYRYSRQGSHCQCSAKSNGYADTIHTSWQTCGISSSFSTLPSYPQWNRRKSQHDYRDGVCYIPSFRWWFVRFTHGRKEDTILDTRSCSFGCETWHGIFALWWWCQGEIPFLRTREENCAILELEFSDVAYWTLCYFDDVVRSVKWFDQSNVVFGRCSFGNGRRDREEYQGLLVSLIARHVLMEMLTSVSSIHGFKSIGYVELYHADTSFRTSIIPDKIPPSSPRSSYLPAVLIGTLVLAAAFSIPYLSGSSSK